jgi:outer membrane receptor protein involved in Fe transport
MKRASLFPLMFSLGSGLSGAASMAEESDDLYAMSLEKLLAVEVSVASTREEKILSTPAVVSRISVAQLRSMGIHRLEDMISMLPGVQVQDTAIGTKAIVMRGIFEAFNQKVLFQLDGVPYWQPAHGDIPLSGISLESISHIEVIRGPGTVFHGSNASAGVINLVSKDSKETSVFGSVSSNEENLMEFYTGTDLGEGRLTISGHWRDGESYDAFFNRRPVPPFYPPGTPGEGEIEKQDQSKSIQVRWQWRDFTAQYHEFRSSNSGLAAVAAITNQSKMEQTGRLLHLNQHWRLNGGELDVYGDYNNYYLEIPTDNLFGGVDDGIQNFGSGSDNHRMRFGAKWVGTLPAGSEYVLGTEVEERSTGDYRNTDAETGETRAITLAADETGEWSVYGQWLKDFDRYRLNVGFRYVDNEKAGSNFLPRISGVYSLSSSSSLKLIYSTGFNSPNLIQQGINIPPNVIMGDPDLKAETVETVDLAYTFNKDNQLLIVNAYYLNAENFIQRQATDFAVKFANAGDFDRYGLEVDYQYATDRLRLISNLAYHFDDDSSNSKDLGRGFVPRWMASMGLHWVIAGPHSIGTSYQYQSDRAAVDKSHYFSAQYKYTGEQLEIMAGVENLLEDDYEVADIQDFNLQRLIGGGDQDQVYRVSARWHW